MTARLLLTGAGTGTAFSYAAAVAQRHPNVALVTGDIHPAPLVSAALFAQRHVQLPPVADVRFHAALLAAIAENRITHYLPILDPEIRLAAEARSELPVELLAPSARFVTFANDKHLYPSVFAELGLRTPRLFHRDRATFPCVAKTPGSFGGRGVRRIESLDALPGLSDDVILQEWVDGPEFTVDCCPLPGRPPLCSVRQRIEVKSGVCTKALIEPNQALEHTAERLVQAFFVTQPFCFQAIGRGGEYWITDVNPRLGAGTAMSAANGTNFFAAHLAQVFGGAPEAALLRHRESCVITRQYVEYASEAP